jgi:hypothetical protein
MKVYSVEADDCSGENNMLLGVYATEEAAKEAIESIKQAQNPRDAYAYEHFTIRVWEV